MKLNIIKTWGAAIVFTWTAVSCEKILDVETPENLIDHSKVFEDVQTSNAALAGVYAGTRDNSLLAGDRSGMLLGVYADDLDSYAISSVNSTYDLYKCTHLANNAMVGTAWTGSYQQVFYANAVLEGIEDAVKIPVAERNRIKGEALFLRSLHFFYLQQVYGDIPYPVTTNYYINQIIERTETTEVLERLAIDLQEAAGLLKDDYSNAERIFVNRKTVEALLAKVYMTQGKFAMAETVLKSIVESPLYVFETDINKVFLKSGKHILWQLKPRNAGDATREASIYYFLGVAPASYALTQDLINKFSSVDQRKTKYMASVTVGSNTWYRAEKYKVRSNNTTEYSIVFRLEEIYFLLAETLVRQNKITEALPYVDAIRLRAGTPALSTSITQAQLLDEILLESRREYFTEMGYRFMALKRFGKLNILQALKPDWKAYHQLWPIPQQELQLNPKLNPQNTGY
ncbi:SusD family protein [compost metagenome]